TLTKFETVSSAYSSRNWGDESPAFVRTLDELVVLGGGEHTGREATLAAKEFGKQVTVFRGFGGSSDELAVDDIPVGASFKESTYRESCNGTLPILHLRGSTVLVSWNPECG